MFNLKESLQKIVSGSELVVGREKLMLDDILDTELHICDFEISDMGAEEGQVYVILNFTEYPEHYTNGGKVLTDLFVKLMENASYDDVRAAVSKEPIACKFTKVKTKDKQKTYTNIEILDI